MTVRDVPEIRKGAALYKGAIEYKGSKALGDWCRVAFLKRVHEGAYLSYVTERNYSHKTANMCRYTRAHKNMKIEGRNPLTEALDSDIKISRIYVSKTAHDLQPLIDKAKNKKIRIDFVDRAFLDKMSESKHHQGIIAVSEEYSYATIEDIQQVAKQKGEKLFVLILDSIEDPHNLGSIIRVAECAGAHGIIIPSRRSASVNATVLRTSAGAANHIKVAMVGNINDAIRQLKDDFVNVYCADMQGTTLYDCRFDEDVAIVIGNEGDGVKALTAKLCDHVVSIPQFGKVNSLNASVACGIICYEIIRQRGKRI